MRLWGYKRCGPNCFYPDCDCKPEWFDKTPVNVESNMATTLETNLKAYIDILLAEAAKQDALIVQQAELIKLNARTYLNQEKVIDKLKEQLENQRVTLANIATDHLKTTPTKKIQYQITIVESERGWGQNYETYLFDTREEAQAAITRTNDLNTSETVPDWYCRAENKIEVVEVDAQNR